MKRVSDPMRVVIAIWAVAILGIVVVAPVAWWFFTNFHLTTNLLSGP